MLGKVSKKHRTSSNAHAQNFKIALRIRNVARQRENMAVWGVYLFEFVYFRICFVNELEALKQNGIVIGNDKIRITLHRA